MSSLKETIDNLCDIGNLLGLYFPRHFLQEKKFEDALKEKILEIKNKKGEIEAAYDIYIVLRYSESLVKEEILKDNEINYDIGELNLEIRSIVEKNLKYTKIIKSIENAEINKKTSSIRKRLFERENECKKLIQKLEASKVIFQNVFEEKYAKALENHMVLPYEKTIDWLKEIKNKYETLASIEQRLLNTIIEKSNGKIKEKLDYAHST